MPQPDDKVGNDGGNNRVSNMPLLFADGYPTSLNKITEAQLEKFIPFMVQCSLGFIQIHTLDEFKEPEWWPRDVEFTNPFRRPKSFTGSWLQKMREIVVVCYSFHDSIYLLRYCNDLASYQPTSLRFINNYNSTTSLYERTANKLLVTFRNENMLYDQEQKLNSRKCLLPKQTNSQHNQVAPEDMVISEGFDIYLCDNCDAELYSYCALVDHEKACLSEKNNLAPEESSDDDDVIYCGEFVDEQLPLGSSARARTELQKKENFLSQNFTLSVVQTEGRCSGFQAVPSPTKVKSTNADLERASNEYLPVKHRRLPRRTHHVMTLGRCPQIPLSSPLGQFLLKSTKGTCTEEYARERFERMERFCNAPPLPPGTSHLLLAYRCSQDALPVVDRRIPKWFTSKPRSGGAFPVTYKRPADMPIEPYRQYKKPRRQYSCRRRMENFLFYNKPLIQRCQPCAVRFKRLTPSEVRIVSEWPGVERRKREAEEAANQERQRRRELVATEMVIESIDLCSSEEEENETEYQFENTLAGENSDDEESLTDFTVNCHDRIEQSRDVRGMDLDIETIVLEPEEMAVVPQTLVQPRDRQCPSSIHPTRFAHNFIGVSRPVQPKSASAVPATMLSASTLRLNQSLPTDAHGNGAEPVANPPMRPIYLYTNCRSTAVNVAGTAPTLTDGNRSLKSENNLLKENRVHGWLQNGITHSGSAGGNATPVPVMAQQHTVLVATPIPNGRALLGTIPVAFGNGSLGLQSHVGASVVQTLTTTTFVNQTVHKRRLSGVPAVTAANLQ